MATDEKVSKGEPPNNKVKKIMGVKNIFEFGFFFIPDETQEDIQFISRQSKNYDVEQDLTFLPQMITEISRWKQQSRFYIT